MNKVINLKGIAGDKITATVNSEDTNAVIIKFDDSEGRGLRSIGDLPELVNQMGWYYATNEDLDSASELYNTEISKTKIWKNRSFKGVRLYGPDMAACTGSLQPPSE